jgi:hypothetical protein
MSALKQSRTQAVEASLAFLLLSSGVSQATPATDANAANSSPPAIAADQIGRGDTGSKREPTHFRVEVNFAGVATSPSEGATELSHWGYGAAFGLGIRHNSIPITFGIDLLGTYLPRFSAPVYVPIGDSRVELMESRSIQRAFYDTFLRAEVPIPYVRPFIEGEVGFSQINTQYSLSFGDGQGATSQLKVHNAGPNWGCGFGLRLALMRARGDSDAALYATIGMRRLWGEAATYHDSAGNTFKQGVGSTLILVGISGSAKPG